jgi:hypothetical protein
MADNIEPSVKGNNKQLSAWLGHRLARPVLLYARLPVHITRRTTSRLAGHYPLAKIQEPKIPLSQATVFTNRKPSLVSSIWKKLDLSWLQKRRNLPAVSRYSSNEIPSIIPNIVSPRQNSLDNAIQRDNYQTPGKPAGEEGLLTTPARAIPAKQHQLPAIKRPISRINENLQESDDTAVSPNSTGITVGRAEIDRPLSAGKVPELPLTQPGGPEDVVIDTESVETGIVPPTAKRENSQPGNRRPEETMSSGSHQTQKSPQESHDTGQVRPAALLPKRKSLPLSSPDTIVRRPLIPTAKPGTGTFVSPENGNPPSLLRSTSYLQGKTGETGVQDKIHKFTDSAPAGKNEPPYILSHTTSQSGETIDYPAGRQTSTPEQTGTQIKQDIQSQISGPERIKKKVPTVEQQPGEKQTTPEKVALPANVSDATPGVERADIIKEVPDRNLSGTMERPIDKHTNIAGSPAAVIPETSSSASKTYHPIRLLVRKTVELAKSVTTPFKQREPREIQRSPDITSRYDMSISSPPVPDTGHQRTTLSAEEPTRSREYPEPVSSVMPEVTEEHRISENTPAVQYREPVTRDREVSVDRASEITPSLPETKPLKPIITNKPLELPVVPSSGNKEDTGYFTPEKPERIILRRNGEKPAGMLPLDLPLATFSQPQGRSDFSPGERLYSEINHTGVSSLHTEQRTTSTRTFSTDNTGMEGTMSPENPAASENGESGTKPDLKALAREVYPFIKRMIIVDRERLPL